MLRPEVFDPVSKSYVQKSQSDLMDIGHTPQVHARSINLFYLHNQLRGRLLTKGDEFEVYGSKLRFKASELGIELQNHPERFSPNVVLRPLYQEFLFPNVAYVGGGGELAYWMELKALFDHYHVHFPMLIRRGSLVQISDRDMKQWKEMGFNSRDFFEDFDKLSKDYATRNSDHNFEIETYKKAISETYDRLANEVSRIDASLEMSVRSEETRHIKSLDILNEKVVKSLKRKHDVEINRINKILWALFPDKKLQERSTNFMTYYSKYGRQWLNWTKEAIDPWNQEMVLLELSKAPEKAN